ncbi:MAG: GGDEF domain-containing protein [Gaiellaceae bacterium]
MSSAASAATPAEQQASSARRQAKPSVTRRSGLQLLAGLLIVAGIPVIATVRILDANALRNERTHADVSLRTELQAASDDLRGRADDASTRATDLSNSLTLQRAFLTGDRAVLARLARQNPGMVFYLHGRRVAGRQAKAALTRPVSLMLNGVQFGRVVATVPLDPGLATHLLRASPRAQGDRLLLVRSGYVLGSGQRAQLVGKTVHLSGKSYRGILGPVPNAPGTNLLAVRSNDSITAAVSPYQQHVLYAAMGSFALLLLVGLLFGGPILRTLGDFRRLASQASTDSLTGLGNRWTFDEELALEWRRAERVGDPLALILADIDDFKAVNDRHGHQLGDEVLRRVGQILADNVRQVDLAARYGGEEFAVIVPETDLEGAIQLAERLRKAFMNEQVELSDGTHITLTASFGAAVKNELPRAEELIAAADEALYEAKRGGKNRVWPELGEVAEEPQPERRRRRTPARAAAKAPAKPPAKAPAKSRAKKTSATVKAPAKKPRAVPKPRTAQGEL